MWQGHLIVPGEQNNVPGWMKFLFWAKSALKRYWFVPDIPRILQYPAGPIWTALDRYIYPEIYFNHKRNAFLPNVPGEQKWRNLNKWPFIDFLPVWHQSKSDPSSSISSNLTRRSILPNPNPTYSTVGATSIWDGVLQLVVRFPNHYFL